MGKTKFNLSLCYMLVRTIPFCLSQFAVIALLYRSVSLCASRFRPQALGSGFSFRSILTFYFMPILLSRRGPWNALSPIPENNAIAVDNQVFINFFFQCFAFFLVRARKCACVFIYCFQCIIYCQTFSFQVFFGVSGINLE